METLKAYRIIKGSSDGTFRKGDIVWKSQNGDLNSVHGRGWILSDEQTPETMDFDYEEAADWKVTKTGSRESCQRVL